MVRFPQPQIFLHEGWQALSKQSITRNQYRHRIGLKYYFLAVPSCHGTGGTFSRDQIWRDRFCVIRRDRHQGDRMERFIYITLYMYHVQGFDSKRDKETYMVIKIVIYSIPFVCSIVTPRKPSQSWTVWTWTRRSRLMRRWLASSASKRTTWRAPCPGGSIWSRRCGHSSMSLIVRTLLRLVLHLPTYYLPIFCDFLFYTLEVWVWSPRWDKSLHYLQIFVHKNRFKI